MAYIYDDSQTYTGEIVNFTSTDKANITSVSVPLTYSQDLHGYANPWPAGGGVNKYGGTINTLFPLSLQSGTVIIVSADLGGASYGVMRTYNSSETFLQSVLIQTQSGSRNYGVITLSSDISYIKVEGNTLTDIQVEIAPNASALPSPYSPYANICPISGLTGLSVYRTGKNLIDPSKKVKTSQTIAKWYNDGVGFLLHGGQSYTLSNNLVGGTVYFYNIDGSALAYGSASKTYTPANDVYVYFQFYSATESEVENVQFQLELGSTATTYEPYNGNTYAVDWSTQAGTVCHGTVDPVTGQLTVDKAYKSFDGSSTTGIGVHNPLSGFWFALPGMTANYSADGMCNMEKTRTSYGTGGVIFGIGNNNYAYFTNLQTISGASTVSDLCSWLQSNNLVIEFVYPLATPLTYQLTPKQIAALTNNYVWVSNGASITVVVSDVLHDFQGWLLKVGSGMTLVPTEMIKAETYKVSPNQRMEETAERDSTGVLWRETVPNMPPKIEFNTPAAYDTDINALNAVFRAAYSNKQERKLTVAFYDPEENVYQTWECYMPNIDFPIRTIDIDAKTIFYDEIRYAFIGY